jgi:DNA-binding NtrC family response regulator
MSTIDIGKAVSREAELLPAVNILLLAENTSVLTSCTGLLRSSGYNVLPCSSYIDLMLHLEREAFQLVMIVDQENSGIEWHELVKQAAETDRGIPVLILSQVWGALNPIKAPQFRGLAN